MVRAGRMTRPCRLTASGAQQGADGKAGDEISKPGLVDVIDVLGHVGQQPVRQGIGRQVHQEGDQQRRQQLRRRPDVDEAFLQLVPGRRPQGGACGRDGVLRLDDGRAGMAAVSSSPST